jgi:hypothetical protein
VEFTVGWPAGKVGRVPAGMAEKQGIGGAMARCRMLHTQLAACLNHARLSESPVVVEP